VKPVLLLLMIVAVSSPCRADEAQYQALFSVYNELLMLNTQLQNTIPLQGPVGDKGGAGDKGEVGDKGVIGDKGVAGYKGLVGPVGPDGDKGPRGDEGSIGVGLTPSQSAAIFTVFDEREPVIEQMENAVNALATRVEKTQDLVDSLNIEADAIYAAKVAP